MTIQTPGELGSTEQESTDVANMVVVVDVEVVVDVPVLVVVVEVLVVDVVDDVELVVLVKTVVVDVLGVDVVLEVVVVVAGGISFIENLFPSNIQVVFCVASTQYPAPGRMIFKVFKLNGRSGLYTR